MRLRPLRQLPMAYGWMTKRPIPHPVTDAWLKPLLSSRQIHRDLLKYIRAASTHDMIAATERLRDFTRPALVAWAAEDRVHALPGMVMRHGSATPGVSGRCRPRCFRAQHH
jgi:hypothetical protein